MKCFLLDPIFKTFSRSTFYLSPKQNTWPVYDANEIKRQEQKKLLKSYICKVSTEIFKVIFKNIERSRAFNLPSLP